MTAPPPLPVVPALPVVPPRPPVPPPVAPPWPPPVAPPWPPPGVPPWPPPLQLAAQTPLHRTWPPAQPQTPLVQIWPTAQAAPQALQLETLLLRSTQLPLQAVCPPPQPVEEQEPLLHTWLPVQALVQLPQWSCSE